jgi:hypothetical protein
MSGRSTVEVISHNSRAVLLGLFALVMFILAVYFASVLANINATATIQSLNPVFIAAITGSLALGGTLISQLWGKETNPLPPIIYNTEPAGTEVSLKPTLRASFSKMMDASSINEDTFTVRDKNSDSNEKGTEVKLEGGNAVLKLSSPLKPSTSYVATIKKDAKDAAGVTLDADYTWSFDTEKEKPVDEQTTPSSISKPEEKK